MLWSFLQKSPLEDFSFLHYLLPLLCPIRWKAPEKYHWKLNVDAMQSKSLYQGGIGQILRDHLVKSIMRVCKHISNNWEVKVLEAKVVVNGLIKIDKHWHGQNFPVEIIFGYLEVVRLMNLQDFGLSRVEFFLLKMFSILLIMLYFIFTRFLKRRTKLPITQPFQAFSFGSSWTWKDVFQAPILPFILKGNENICLVVVVPSI